MNFFWDNKGVFNNIAFAQAGYKAIMNDTPLDFSALAGKGIPGLTPADKETNIPLIWQAGAKNSLWDLEWEWHFGSGKPEVKYILRSEQ